jgi:hypothetical protein
VRLATRYVFREEVEIQIDGSSGVLFDISVAGCQLLSPAALQPDQVVHVLLPSEQTPTGCTGKVVWVRLEPRAASGPLPHYRAGMSFINADRTGIEAFAARRGARS